MSMSDKPQRPKPVKWKADLSGPCCLACVKPFRRGDDVYPLGPTCIHAGCVKLYLKQCKELGITP